MKTLFTITFLLIISLNLFSQEAAHILIVTGGHDFDRPAFFKMFDSFDSVTYQEVVQPKANELIEGRHTAPFDLLLFYDMYDSITPAQQKAYLGLLKEGKPMIFLHHALVSYQDWPEFTQIIGGKYVQQKSKMRHSNYEHDVVIPVEILDTDHPITAGLKDFEIFDETYGNCFILEKVHPLLGTQLEKSMPLLAWTNIYENTAVIYIQSGHGPEAFADANFRKLLHQAIHWSLEKHK